MPKKPKPRRSTKPKSAENVINGNVSGSAFVQGVQGVNNGNVVVNNGNAKSAQEEQITAMFNSIIDKAISDLDSNFNTKKE